MGLLIRTILLSVELTWYGTIPCKLICQTSVSLPTCCERESDILSFLFLAKETGYCAKRSVAAPPLENCISFLFRSWSLVNQLSLISRLVYIYTNKSSERGGNVLDRHCCTCVQLAPCCPSKRRFRGDVDRKLECLTCFGRFICFSGRRR